MRYCHRCRKEYADEEFEGYRGLTKTCFECRYRSVHPSPTFSFRPVLALIRERLRWHREYTGEVNRWGEPKVRNRRAGMTTKIAQMLGANYYSVQNWRKNGMTAVTADRIAVKLGKHPIELWPDFWDEWTEEELAA